MAQYFYSSAVIETIPALDNASHEVHLGFKWRLGKAYVLDFAQIENIITMDNSPDFPDILFAPALGIEAHVRSRLGANFDFQDLQRRGFDAVFIGTGAWLIPPLDNPGETAAGLVASIDFLEQVGTEIMSLAHRRIVVLGESNTAMDCARSAIRLGAVCVDVICPGEEKQMRARKRDVARALEEGVRILFQMRPVRIVTDDHCRVSHVACVSTAGEEDPSALRISDGRPGALISADMVIRADLL